MPDNQRPAIEVPLTSAEIQQAWADGEAIQKEDRRWIRHGDTPKDPLTLISYSMRGRVAEIAVEKWLGLPLLPRHRYNESHFDTHDPWTVQVKSVGDKTGALTIGLSKRHCWTCPYILAWVADPCLVVLLGWSTGPEVKELGYRVRWGADGESICLPQEHLHPLPGPADIHARMFHRGMRSICPEGRNTASLALKAARARRVLGTLYPTTQETGPS